MKGSGKTAITHNSSDLELHWLHFDGLVTLRLITSIKSYKGYLKSCHGKCVPKFSPSDVTNMTLEEEPGNPHLFH